MAIEQISLANTFGQLVTTVSGLVAVANNFTDGPAVVSNANWTFSNPDVGINVGNTALITTANVGTLNLSTGNVSNITIATANASVANLTVANIGGATIGNISATRVTTTNANVNFIQVDDRANVYSLNAQSANIGTLAITTLSVTSLTVPVLNTSFANITDATVTGTFQATSLTATLTTVTNANVTLLNSSTANITGATVGTLNVSHANVTSFNVGAMNLSLSNVTTLNVGSVLHTPFANAVLANIITLNTSTANISNLTAATLNASSANLTTGTMAANPTTNLGIATKNYADTGAGGNLVNKITYAAKGDLIPGTGANTFGVLSTGSNGQTLIVDTNQTTGLRWANRAAGRFRGFTMTTSLADKSANGTQLIVYRLDEVTMDDGEIVSNWTVPSTIDITASGVNGLDGGSANANTVYEVYAIRQRSTGIQGFILHRALDRKPDQNTFVNTFWPMASATTALNSLGANNTSNLYIKLAQSFTPNVTGNIASIDLKLMKTGTPTGNMWVTLEANTAEVPAGTTLVTSRKMDVSRCPSTGANVRFVFDNTTSLTAGTSYFWIFNSDYAGSTTAFINVAYSGANTNIGANGVNRGVPYGNTGASWVNIQGTTQPGQTLALNTFFYRTQMEANNVTVTMPTGYDQKCLLGYVFTDDVSKLKESSQFERTIHASISQKWGAMHSIYGTTPSWIDIVELNSFVPPITCSVVFIEGSTAIQQMAIGRFHALDLTTTFSENLGGGIQASTSGGTTTTPIAPLFVEHQAVVVKVPAQNLKLYPIAISF